MTEREIFTAALRYTDAAERAAFLEEACAGQSALRERVDKLIGEHENLGSFLESGFRGPTRDEGTIDLTGIERAGASIGPYKLLQQIGEGGFGLVFMAEQTAPVRRKVAIKVIKPGMDTRQVIARFEAERQALAVMDHPHIARVLDAGATESGRPYFVMELVRGVPITSYCDENNLPIRQRLSLFATVCQAIQHAHTKGIIHRDIKPSNVLVTRQDGEPIVKVIDFGVAKAMGQQLTEKTLFTDFRQMIGTPLYMSPEQAELSSVDIDTRSDIYSLGVLLYELLTGTTPVSKEQLKQAAFDEIRRIIREDEPQKPSTRISTAEAAPSIAAQRHTEPAKLAKLVRGELDWIVMKALDKDRNRRYESAGGFAKDIEHYLNDESVQACPPSTGYRLRKFARRNKATLAFAGVVAAALLLTIIGLVVSNLLVREQRNEKIAALGQKEKALGEKQAALGAKEAALKKARSSADNARKHQRLAEAQEKLAQRRFYAAQMNLAMQAWKEGNVARTVQLLESQRPKFDEHDLRSFDWYYLWRLCQGTHRFSTAVHGYDNSAAVAISPDGATLAGAYGTDLRLWSMADGRPIGDLPGHVGNIGWISFAPDGETVAVRDESAMVKLWDLPTRTLRGAIEAGGGNARMQFTGDGQKLISSGNGVKIWDLATNKITANLGEGEYKCGSVATSDDGAAVVASGHSIIRIWIRDGDGWREAPPLRGNYFGPAVAITGDGKILAVAGGKSNYGSPELYDLPECRPRKMLEGHTAAVFGLEFTADGKRLVTGSMDRSVRTWDVESGLEVSRLAQPGPVYGLAISPDGARLAAKGADTIHVWDTATLPAATILTNPSSVDAVAFSPDGKILAALGQSETRLWNVADEQSTASLPSPGPTLVRGLAFSPDGKMLAIPCLNDIHVWSNAGQEQAVLHGDSPVHGVAWSANAKWLAAAAAFGGQGGSIDVWDVAAKRRRYSIRPGLQAMDVDFSPDDKLLAASFMFGVVKLYDAASGREVSTLQRHELSTEWGFCVKFSPDGRKLATGSQLGVVRIFDVATFRLDATLVGHTDHVQSLAFLDGGRTLASGGADRTIRLWDVATGQERMALEGHEAVVTSLDYFEEEGVLASASLDGTVRLWRAAFDDRSRAPRSEMESYGAQATMAENEFGDRCWQAGRTNEAEAAYRRALGRLEKLHAAHPEKVAYQQELVRSQLSLALLLRIEQGDASAAETMRARAMEIYQKLTPVEQRALFFVFSERQRKLFVSDAMAQADRTLDQMIELGPQDDVGWMTRCAQHLAACTADPRLRNPARAVEIARRAVTLPTAPNHELAAAWACLGGALECVGRRAEAEKPYREAIELWRKSSADEPTNQWYPHEQAFFSLALANLLVAEGRREEALAPCRESVELNKRLVTGFSDGPERLGRARGVLISILSSLGRDEEATKVTREQEEFAAAQAALPKTASASPPPSDDRGWLLLTEEKFAEAEAAFRARIQLAPNDAWAHRGLGTALESQKKLPEAIAAYREAIRLDPWDVNLHDRLGWVYVNSGEFAQAEFEFGEALRLYPKGAWSHFGLANALRGQGKLAEAMAEFREGLRLLPDSASGRIELGKMLVEEKRFEEAEAEFREALRLEPENPWAPELLDRALVGQGKPPESKSDSTANPEKPQ